MPIDLTTSISNAFVELIMLLAPVSDLILKSGFVVLLASLACFLFNRILNPSSRHLLWLNVLVCIILIPLLPLINAPSVEQPNSGPAFDVITLSLLPLEAEYTNASSINDSVNAVDWKMVILGGYLLIFIALLCRILRDAIRIFLISQRAKPVTTLALVKRINNLKQQLNICRPVLVKFSDEVTSPVSFGLFKPVVIFPMIAREWPEQPFNSALIHELSHISRVDWLTSTGGYCFCSLFWINPFAWYALRKMNVEAESASDMAVLRSGVGSREYAQDLLSITRSCKQTNNENLLAQYMLSSQLLKSRVALLLESQAGKSESSKLVPPAIIPFFAAILVLLSTGSFLRVAIVDDSIPLYIQQMFQSSELAMRTSPFIRAASTSDDVVLLSYSQNPYSLPQSLPEERFTSLPALTNTRIQIASNELKQWKASSEDSQFSPSPDPTTRMQMSTTELLTNFVPAAPPKETTASAHGLPAKPETSTSDQVSPIATLSMSALNQEIEKIEIEYYRVFNAGEEDESLHILCGDYRPTGSFIPKRYCEPRFVINARSNSLSAHNGLVTALIYPAALQGGIYGKFDELTDALNITLRENSHFRELHVYLSDLKSSI